MGRSKKGKLNKRDLFRGLIITIGGGILAAIIDITNSGELPDEQSIVKIGLGVVAGGLSYLLLQLRTDENGNLYKDKL